MTSTRKYQKLSLSKHSNDIRDSAQVVQADLPPPSSGQILIKNHYAGVNAVDMSVMTGRSPIFPKTQIPFELGLEGLGTIEAIGDGIDPEKFPVGKPGLIFASPPKTYAEYLYIKPEEFIPVPDIRPEYIALLDCGLTASLGLDKAGRIQPGETVLITAAAGGTGHLAVQWAKLKGCQRVAGLCSTSAKAEFLKSIGCDVIINYKEDDVDEILRKEFPNGIDVIWETYGGTMFEKLFQHLAIGGRIIIVGAITGYKTIGFPDIKIEQLPIKLLNKSASITGFRFRHYEKFFPEYLENLIEMFRNGKLFVQIDINGSGVESAINAIEHLHSGRNLGKVIVQIQK